jgi:hypothetical protein
VATSKPRKPKRESNKKSKISVDYKFGFERKVDQRISPKCASCFNYLDEEEKCAKISGYIAANGVCNLHEDVSKLK